MLRNKIRFRSLQLRSTLWIAVFLIVTMACYYLTLQVGTFFIDEVYMSEARTAKREERRRNKLQEYVIQENLSVLDTEKIQQWCDKQNFVRLSVYRGGYLYYETNGKYLNFSPSGETPMTGNYPTVRFRDGEFKVELRDFSERFQIEVLDWGALIMAGLLFVIMTLIYMSHLIRRITDLSRDIREVCDGNIAREIICGGHDEIADLGSDVNDMRKSIMYYYQNEQRALQANTSLMTSLSHDIRTPLTALLLYADALAEETADAQDTKKYAELCRQKAYHLKELTDTMFRYFLVFGKQKEQLHMQSFQISELIGQLLVEHSFDLKQKGFEVESDPIESDGEIVCDVMMLKRVFDNVFSNLEKYADPARPIQIHITVDRFLQIEIINGVVPSVQAESTGIGLKSCEHIMNQLLGGSFTAKETEDGFLTWIRIPLKEE